VRLYFGIAKVNDSLLSISDLLKLLPDQKTEVELELAIRSNPSLDSSYEVKSGFIIERSAPKSAEESGRAGRLRALSNVTHGKEIADMLLTGNVRMIGISGSTSYGSASRSNDVDYFSVTEKQRTWVFLTRALIVSRVARHLKRGAPEICLSCTVDTEYAERFFSERNSPLFARDALSTIVVHGREYYSHLLDVGRWISQIYPILYSTRVGKGASARVPVKEPSAWWVVLNKFLYVTVGTYIRAKSHLHNLEFLKRGQRDSVFKLLIGEDHCIYESTRYSKMRGMYETLEEN